MKITRTPVYIHVYWLQEKLDRSIFMLHVLHVLIIVFLFHKLSLAKCRKLPYDYD